MTDGKYNCVLPWDGGKPVTKSRATCDQGQQGVGRGSNSPAGGRFPLLDLADVTQAETNSLISEVMVGHQKYLVANEFMRLAPG